MKFKKFKSIIEKGKEFKVTFIKRSTGLERVMTCKYGEFKSTTGKGFNFKPEKYDLLPVYEIDLDEYRMVNLRGLKRVELNGKEYEYNIKKKEFKKLGKIKA